MPNYVQNKIKITSPNIKQILNRIKGEDRLIDFNQIIPMPPSMHISSGSVQDLSFSVELYMQEGILSDELKNYYEKEKYLNESIESYFDRLEKEEKINRDLGRTAYQNQKQYGYTDWYGWSIARWGTKWNAIDTAIKEEDNSIFFKTAWDAPIPVIQKLASMFSDSIIMHWYADEDVGFHCGWMSYKDGKLQETYDAQNESNMAYEIYELCWGESSCVFTDDQGNKQVRDCENCHGCDDV